MKDFLEFTFDFFVHVLPGSLVIIAVSLLFIDIDPNNITGALGEYEATDGIAFALFSFIVGLAVNPLGKMLLKNVGFKIWKMKVLNNVDMFVSDKFVLIREHSPSNFKYVEKWNMYCALYYNLAFASLTLCVVSAINAFTKGAELQLMWTITALVSLALSFVFLKNSAVYSLWAQHDLNAAVKTLILKEKTGESGD